MEVHVYKGFNLVKNGFPKTPWNIYKINGHGYGEWLWYGTTLEGCKADIDRGCFDNPDLAKMDGDGE